jgi:hypothetical protein
MIGIYPSGSNIANREVPLTLHAMASIDSTLKHTFSLQITMYHLDLRLSVSLELQSHLTKIVSSKASKIHHSLIT